MKTTTKIHGGLVFAGMLCALWGSAAFSQIEPDHPIFAAAENGNTDLIKAMVTSNSAILELHDRYGKTPLHYAICGNHMELTTYFLAQGASIMSRDNRGWTALHHAAENGNPVMTELLIHSNAQVNAVNTMQWTALHQAALRGHIRVIMCLVGNGADVLAKNNHDSTAYNIAIDNGQLAIKDFLISQMLLAQDRFQSAKYAKK